MKKPQLFVFTCLNVALETFTMAHIVFPVALTVADKPGKHRY